VPFYGLAVLCLDHPRVQELLPRIKRRHVTYGLSPQADYSARMLSFAGIHTHFSADRRGESLGEFSVRMPGQHNVLNCLAAIAIADELEVPLDVIKDALATFHGVARRFSVVDEVDGVTLVDDYGHHPAEIIATLEAARRVFEQKVLVAFQPHRYSRTRLLFDEFTRAFNKADLVLVADIYPAGEAPIEGVSAARLVQAVAEHGHHAVHYVPERAELALAMARQAKAGDVVIALGAGDIHKVLLDVKAAILARRAERKGCQEGGA
jgi:UDP-N-acetylmuramate--alanine ligase